MLKNKKEYLRYAFPAVIISSFLVITPLSAEPPSTNNTVAMPLFQDLGDHQFSITTSSAKAQQYFNQGLILAYGFNHSAALKSFQQASKYDPNTAMAYWGQAYVLGPNLNLPMDPNNESIAYSLVQKAKKLSQHATQKEKDFIDALSQRYSQTAIQDRQARDKAWAAATQTLYQAYPYDADVAALRASSLMLLRPWNYWQANGDPYPEAATAIAILEKSLENHPNHIGLIHYYIHAVEASKAPKKAEAAADRLNAMKMGTGHLAHMPSHIYMRIGRYEDAIEANQRAVNVDESFIQEMHAKGVYPALYYPHNIHFLSWAYMIQGRSQDALATAEKSARFATPEAIKKESFLNSFAVIPYFTLVRFNQWDDILKLKTPADDQFYMRGIWLYATGMAYAQTGNIQQAENNLNALIEIANNEEVRNIILLSYNTAGPILDIAKEALSAEIADQRGDMQAAITHYKKSIELEDALNYNEPPDWLIPTRQVFGNFLLKQNQASQAEAIFRADLKKHPNSGWSLLGLYRSLKQQNKMEQAADIKQQLDRVWSKADKTFMQEV